MGVQTWGSAILLGRELALRPADFGLRPRSNGLRVLELGAGTGLLSILCRKILDLHRAEVDGPPGLVVATDFHPDVLSNLKVCVDLNFPAQLYERSASITPSTDISPDAGIHIAKLDWTTFPGYMAAKQNMRRAKQDTVEETACFMEEPFDLVLASDCVYDPTHAAMLRQVAAWTLRPPDPDILDDVGGTFVSGADAFRSPSS